MQYTINTYSYTINPDTRDYTLKTYIIDEPTFNEFVKEHDNFYGFKKHSSLNTFKKIHKRDGSISFQYFETVNVFLKTIYSKPVDDIINNL